MKVILTSSLKILFAAGLLFWFVRSGKVDFTNLREMMGRPALFLFAALAIFNFLFNSERWRNIMAAVSLPVGFWKAVSLSLIGNFFNFFIPGGVSGDLVKGYYTTKEFPAKRADGAVSVLFDRILGLYTMMLVSFLSMSFAFEYVRPSTTLVMMYFFLIACLVGGLTIYSFHQVLHFLSDRFQVLRPVKRIATFLSAAKKRPGRIFLSILQSFISQFLVIAFFYLYARLSPGSEVLVATPAVFFFAVPVGFMATAIPISPGGVGVGQSAFFYLFNLVLPGQGGTGALGFTLLLILQFLLGLVGGFLFLVYRRGDSIREVTRDNIT